MDFNKIGRGDVPVVKLMTAAEVFTTLEGTASLAEKQFCSATPRPTDGFLNMIGTLIILAGLWQPVADIPTVVVTPPVHAPDTVHQRASAFMSDYFRHLSSPDVLEDFERDYAPYVSYYDKRVDRATLMRDKARFVHRWPQRSYRLREESLDVSCDTPDLCMVTGLVDFECRSAERHAVSTGVARFYSGIWFKGADGQIVAEQSDVIRQP